MDFKDYYAILGVQPNADKKLIQQTYRQLARKCHPDVNPGNKEAEEKFKTINEAYQVLSHVEQRKKYDELRGQYQQWQQAGSQKQDFNWQNWSAQPGKGVHVQYATPEDLEDLFGSDSPYSDFFTSIFGQAPRSSGGRGRSTSPTRSLRCTTSGRRCGPSASPPTRLRSSTGVPSGSPASTSRTRGAGCGRKRTPV